MPPSSSLATAAGNPVLSLSVSREERDLGLFKQCHGVSLFKHPTGHTSEPMIPNGIQLKSFPFPQIA